MSLPAPLERAPSTATAKLRAEGLRLRYGLRQALKGVDLSLAEGDITALIGPSGCGKTSFLRTLNRMIDTFPEVAVEGRVLLDGEDILGPGVDTAALRRRVGMVFQHPALFPGSVLDNVAFGLRLQGVRRAEALDRAEQALATVGLLGELPGGPDRPAAALDLGQQQRMCVARALAVEPEVLLLDEPTVALDPLATARLEALLGELRGRCTLVMVTHNLQQASRVSDHTAFFLDGELVEADHTSALFTRPRDLRTEDYITGRFG